MELSEHCSILKISERSGILTSDGGVAQLGEHLPCKQGVRSSILLISTRGRKTSCGINEGKPTEREKGN